MKYYHGSHKRYEKELIGSNPLKIDVSKGGGELGQGFYTTDRPWVAISWVKAKYGNNGIVCEYNFENIEGQFYSLKCHLIRTVREVLGIYIGLRRKKLERLYKFNVDIVDSPFVSIDSVRQNKFESKNAEFVLNQAKSRKIPI